MTAWRRARTSSAVVVTRSRGGRARCFAQGHLASALMSVAAGCTDAVAHLPVRFGDGVFAPDIDRLLAPGAPRDDDTVAAVLQALRADNPETFGFTPAPANTVRAPGEHEPRRALRMVYPGWEDHDDFYGHLIQGATGHGVVHVHLLRHRDRWRLRALLNRFGVAWRQVQVHTAPTVESIWIRDYGPLSVEVGGRPCVVDGRYNVDSVHDDAMASRLARAAGVPVLRPPLLLEGGNLLSDGQGTCFTTHNLAACNRLTEEELAVLLDRYFGFRRVVFLEPLSGDVIDHVDMLLAVADADTLLLARADPLMDPDNHAILEENAARLATLQAPSGQPYRIVRVPMPPPLPYNPANDSPHHVRSYLNLVPFNGVVLVPVFRASLHLEHEALAQIAAAFPGREVVPIPADTVAASYGAVRCATQTS